MNCDTCGHSQTIHNDKGCRKTDCTCEAFKIVGPTVLEPSVRRVTLDLPDGYMVTVSLVPYTEQPAAKDDE